ncbi:MAG: hypothetical protein NVS3B10_25500 [Polyangiales bacterium]
MRVAVSVASLAGAAGCGPARETPNPVSVCLLDAAHLERPMFHGDRARTGWSADERSLTPARIASGDFAPRWSSPPFDTETLGGKVYAGRTYASPLYLDDVDTARGRQSLLFAATSNGWVYAVRAFPARCTEAAAGDEAPPGTIVWRTRLGVPQPIPRLDGGVPVGVLGTPAIDVATHRLYVASLDADAGYRVFALDLGTGAVIPGWPVTLDDAALGAVNGNGPARFFGGNDQSQRGALNLSPDGSLLYVPFGAFYDEAPGWLAAIDTRTPRLRAAFSGAPTLQPTANAGIWGAGGATIDGAGAVYVTTGNGPLSDVDAAHAWGQSLLRFDPTLGLLGSYTPYDYCELEKHDIDVGGSSPMLLPDLDPATTATPHLVAFGGKQGTVYLLDRDRIAPRVDRRRACSTDPASDESLLGPESQPALGARGPLSVFGPYSEEFGNRDFAKMRSTLAYFRDEAGRSLLFAAGSTKAAVDSPVSVAPSLARLQVVTEPGAPAYLRVDAYEPTLVFVNPGAPVVSSDAGRNAVVWVLDENAPRTASLLDPATPHPVLYAVDATSMRALWRSAPSQLSVGGKYATPVVAHGMVFVGTDRLEAFGVGGGGLR